MGKPVTWQSDCMFDRIPLTPESIMCRHQPCRHRSVLIMAFLETLLLQRGCIVQCDWTNRARRCGCHEYQNDTGLRLFYSSMAPFLKLSKSSEQAPIHYSSRLWLIIFSVCVLKPGMLVFLKVWEACVLSCLLQRTWLFRIITVWTVSAVFAFVTSI